MRKPTVVGQFYDYNFDGLTKQIESCFIHKLGSGKIEKRTDKKIYGIISPHAGYSFSGPCMTYSYRKIAENKFPELFIILGTNHSGIGKNSAMLDNWETPLGMVKTDKNFIEKLGISTDESTHKNEHSIEVQLPFLQYANKDQFKKIKIVGISINEYDKKLSEKIIKLNKNVCIIASGDFTHYGSSYGFVPFEENIKENLYKLDKDAIKFIENLDSKGFLSYIKETGVTICGKNPIAIAIDCVKLLGAKRGRLLKYYTSDDIINNYSSVVGYASIVFE